MSSRARASPAMRQAELFTVVWPLCLKLTNLAALDPRTLIQRRRYVPLRSLARLPLVSNFLALAPAVDRTGGRSRDAFLDGSSTEQWS
jgi:hypothetical protein